MIVDHSIVPAALTDMQEGSAILGCFAAAENTRMVAVNSVERPHRIRPAENAYKIDSPQPW